MEPSCTLTSKNIILETSQEIITYPKTIQLPQLKINTTFNHCCKSIQQLDPVKLKPITLINLDLNDLKITQHKINEIGQTLQNQLQEPFVIEYENNILKWFFYTMIAILTLIAIYYTYKFRILHIFKRILLQTFNCLIPCRDRQKINLYDIIFKKDEENARNHIRSDKRNDLPALSIPQELKNTWK